MTYFGHGGHELRDIHDWDNPIRWLTDLIELPTIILMILFGFSRALRFEEGIPGRPIWTYFTSWHDAWHLMSGAFLFSAGLLLLRDWGYGHSEREEEQKRRKLFEEERAGIIHDETEHE